MFSRIASNTAKRSVRQFAKNTTQVHIQKKNFNVSPLTHELISFYTFFFINLQARFASTKPSVTAVRILI